jgi:Tfp pilus assembly protein PilN
MNGKMPIYALLLAGVVQVVGGGVWVGSIQTTVNQQQRWIEANTALNTRLSVLESQQADIKRILERVERRLDSTNWRNPGTSQ